MVIDYKMFMVDVGNIVAFPNEFQFRKMFCIRINFDSEKTMMVIISVHLTLET